MNRKQFLVVLGLLLLIGGAGIVLLKHHRESWSGRPGRMGDKVVPDFRLNDVAAIRVRGPSAINVVRSDGVWRVRERNGFPANFEQIRELLIRIRDLKVVQSDKVGPSQLDRVDLGEPGVGPGKGIALEFFDAQGKLLNALRLGKMHLKREEGSVPLGLHGLFDGRYALIPEEPENVLLISDELAAVGTEPQSWLNRDFFKIEKIQYLALVSTNASSSWSLARESESWPWMLNDASPGTMEVLNTNMAAQLAEIVGFLSFEDVASNSPPAQTGLDQPTLLTILTFDHFAYTLKIGGRAPEGNRYLKVAVSADIPAQDGASVDSTQNGRPDEKGRLDQEFQDRGGKLRDRLTRERELAQWTYLVDPQIIEPLVRDRSQFLEKNTKSATLGGEANKGSLNLIK